MVDIELGERWHSIHTTLVDIFRQIGTVRCVDAPYIMYMYI